jgi:predicted ATP-dependent endonuclease of OLD family
MRIASVTLKNFRGYKDETKIAIGDFTALIGKNDVGKSTIIEALDIFFYDGKGLIKFGKDDINKNVSDNANAEAVISVCFENLDGIPIIIDSMHNTTLEQEYLVNQDGQLEVIKKFSPPCKVSTFIRAFHPTNPNCNDLLDKSVTELKKIIKDKKIECESLSVNAIMRTAIWNYYHDELQFGVVDIDVATGGTKSIWANLSKYLPLYSLFQADRQNNDGDDEVQDPLRQAVKEILHDQKLQADLDRVANEVREKLKEVSSRTLSKLEEMSPEIAKSLNPIIPETNSLKWEDVFKKVSISGDNDIPINKRGSGVKRLVLLNFFRAEAERRLSEKQTSNIIYAFEEPETSQHTENQKKLIKAFLELSSKEKTQVIITTHSPIVVQELQFKHLKLILDDGNKKSVHSVGEKGLPCLSLNEVNYIAFSEISEAYHDELYNLIEGEGLLNKFKEGKKTRVYWQEYRNKPPEKKQKILSEYIRNQIHHADNKRNIMYTHDELEESIKLMRTFIKEHEDDIRRGKDAVADEVVNSSVAKKRYSKKAIKKVRKRKNVVEGNLFPDNKK